MAMIAVLVSPNFEDAELEIPCDALRDEGHTLLFVGTDEGAQIEGRQGEACVTIDAAAADVDIEGFDAVLLIGGDVAPRDENIVALVRDAVDLGKLIAASNHAPRLLVDAEVASNVRLTSSAMVRGVLREAGARWVDQPVVEDEDFITSQKGTDLEAFSRALVSRLTEAVPSTSSPASLHF